LDSIVPSEEEDVDRRGSLPSTPRGTRLAELLQDRKKKTKRREKHGFTWSPFIRDEELPLPRTPQPQMLPVKQHIRQNGDIFHTKNTTDLSSLRPGRNDDDIEILAVTNSVVQPEPEPRKENIFSENLLKSSDCQDTMIPKQVSDCYNQKATNESVALERKSSVRKLQQQHYMILNDVVDHQNQNQAPQKPNRSHKKLKDEVK